ncbi:MAG: hypothetical protein ABIO86_19920 [Sphingomonas sp.]
MLAIRQAERLALRAGLSPAAADAIDQIEELDLQYSATLVRRLAETARLAPEAFPSPVIDYAFRLIEARQVWFDDAGLQVLAVMGADPGRLARCSMMCLQDGRATRVASRILLQHLSVADENLIPAVLPTLIRMASPDRQPFQDPEPPRVAPLVLLNAAYPQQVGAALDALLEGAPDDIDLVACAVKVLARRDPLLAARFSRDLIAKFVRAPWMPDPDAFGHDDELTHVAHDLRAAVIAAFLQAPDAVDTLLQDFRVGASDAGEVRIFSVYAWVLRAGRFRKKRHVVEADQLAFRRLLWEAPKNGSERVLREIQSLVSHGPDDLIDLAREGVDHLIGAAILMDGRIVEFDAEPTRPNSTMLDAMERSNRRAILRGLRNGFVSWAAAGAAAAATPAAYLDILKGLPEDRDDLAACMIEHSVSLMDSVAGLNAVLPSLYSSLVGTSVVRRGSAARAYGDIPSRQRDNLPELLFEAFLTTLSDAYVYVHRAAVMALGHFRMPQKFDGQVRNTLWNILLAHEKDPKRQDLILECVELLAYQYLTEGERGGPIGAFLISILARLPATTVSQHLRVCSRQLADAAGLVDLLVGVLLDPEATEYTEEHALEAMGDLPPAVINAHRAKLAMIPVGVDREARFRTLDLIQMLTRSGAWAEAEQLAATAVAAIPDTVREASVRRMFELAHAAAAFENALAIGDGDRAAGLAARWRVLQAAKEENDRVIAQRPDPFRDVRRTA